MDFHILILLFGLIIYLPLTFSLLYVWYKFGKGENGVKIARIIFLLGSIFIIGYLFTL